MAVSDFAGLTPLAFGFAPSDIAIVAVVVLVLFGGSKIATMGKSLGEGIREFKKATRDEEPASKTDNDAPAADAAKTPVATVRDEEKQQ